MSVAIPTEQQLKRHQSAAYNNDNHKYKATFERQRGRLRVVCAICRQRHKESPWTRGQARPEWRPIEAIGDTLRGRAHSPNGITLGQLRLIVFAAESMGLDNEARIEATLGGKRGRLQTLTIRPAHIMQLVDEVTGRTA